MNFEDLRENSQLGETRSDPRIFRIPNNGAGDTNVEVADGGWYLV